LRWQIRSSAAANHRLDPGDPDVAIGMASFETARKTKAMARRDRAFRARVAGLNAATARPLLSDQAGLVVGLAASTFAFPAFTKSR
jgi:hypothetical protein